MNIFYHPNRSGLMQENELVQRVDSLNGAAKDMISLALVEGLELSKRAYQLATSDEFRQNPYSKGVADALLNMGYFHLEEGDSMLALAQAKEALQIYREIHDPANQASCLRLLGMVYIQLNEYNKAMDSLLKALEIARRLPDQRLLGEISMSIGHTYLASAEFEPAITELKKAIAIFQRHNLSVPLSFAYNYLSMAYKFIGDFEVFQQYITRASELADDMRVEPVCISVLEQKGQDELRLGNIETAALAFEQGRQMAQKQGYQSAEISCNIWLSEVDHYRNNQEEAIARLTNAVARAQINHDEDGCLRANRKLAQLYAEVGDYKQAYENFQNFYQIEQRIKRERSDLKYITLETIIRTDALQKEAQIIQTKNDQIEKEISERKWVEEALRQSEDKLRRALDLDATTSVNTLRHFYSMVEQEVQRIQRYPHPLSLMIIDIKDFQEVNERFGYLNGDKVLQWVARHLKDLLRAVDVIGRHGGDAFILLLPETSLENAKTVAIRINQHFSTSYLEIGEEKLNLEFHIGMTEYQSDIPVDIFIHDAEKALEVAKNELS